MNQRRRTRVEARKKVTVTWSGGECEGELVNLSLKGCLVGGPQGPESPVDADVKVTIHLEPGAAELDLRVLGKVVRVDAGGIAVDFTEIELESFSHLFRLVQYNAPDPEHIEQEIGETAFTPNSE